MDINLKLKYPSGNKVSVLSIKNYWSSINRTVMEIYKTPIDLAIKKLKKLEG